MFPQPIALDFPALQFDQPWRLVIPDFISDPETSINFDEQLLQRVIHAETGPSLCIKRDPRCLVVTRREARMPNFEQASRMLAAEGWPVVVRCSGGSCVPQGKGVLNLSLVHPKPKKWQLEDGFKLLCELLSRLLVSYGLSVELGEVQGSFCDGRYNLQAGGKKLVGTAQRWAGSNRQQSAVLAHACLLVDLDLLEATEKVNIFYRLCGNRQQFDPQACTTLRQCLGDDFGQVGESLMLDVEQRLVALVKDSFRLED